MWGFGWGLDRGFWGMECFLSAVVGIRSRFLGVLIILIVGG